MFTLLAHSLMTATRTLPWEESQPEPPTRRHWTGRRRLGFWRGWL